MKLMEIRRVEISRRVITKCTCDECEEDCLNTHFDILSKSTFSDEYNLIETLCWKCWEKKYQKKEEKKRDEERLSIMKS